MTSLHPTASALVPGEDSNLADWEQLRVRPDRAPDSAWLTTVDATGRPRTRPVLALWRPEALYIIVNPDTRKVQNLLANPALSLGLSWLTLPAVDVTIEGTATLVEDPLLVAEVGADFKAWGWPLTVRGVEIDGPSAPTAGPPPYRIVAIQPDVAYAFPGTAGVGVSKEAPRPVSPTRWRFA